MFAPDHRLKGKRNFDRVKKEGELYQADDFGVRVLKKSDEELSKFGLVVSTKISKIAVHRNRIKRAFREAIRQNITDFLKGYDMVFLAKKSIARKRIEEIMRQIDKFFKNKNFFKTVNRTKNGH